MGKPSHPIPPVIPPFACCYNDQRNLLASGGANGFFSIQMILFIHGLRYHMTILKTQLPHPVSALTWISSNTFPPEGSLAIGLRNGLVVKLNFWMDRRNTVSNPSDIAPAISCLTDMLLYPACVLPPHCCIVTGVWNYRTSGSFSIWKILLPGRQLLYGTICIEIASVVCSSAFLS